MADFSQVPIGAVRDYWDRRPCNVRHSTSPKGSREYFDEVEERKYRVEPHIPAFADFTRWRGRRVLELGCGIGTDTVNFARAGAHVTAVDLSQESLDLAAQRVDTLGLAERVRFFQANGEELSGTVPLEPYDLIYSFGVIHHTPHPDRVIAELRRYLAPGGEMRIMVYHRRSWKVLWSVLGYGRGKFWKVDEIVARHSEAQTGCPVTYTYTRDQGRALLESQGLRVTEVQVDYIFPYRVPDYVEYRYVREWWFRAMPPALFRRLEQSFGWHLCLAATTS